MYHRLVTQDSQLGIGIWRQQNTPIEELQPNVAKLYTHRCFADASKATRGTRSKEGLHIVFTLQYLHAKWTVGSTGQGCVFPLPVSVFAYRSKS